MSNKVIFELKWNYNHLLTRYYKGCAYLEKNPNEIDRWKGTLLEILEDMQLMIEELEKNGVYMTTQEILSGFKMDEEKQNALF